MSPGRRTALQLAGIVVVLAGVTLTAGLTTSAGGRCTGPRWPVKTLADTVAPYVDRVPQPSTVGQLTGQHLPPVTAKSPRTPLVETRLLSVPVELVGGKLVHDGDLQLVVRDPRGGGTMIAEMPDAACLDHGVSSQDRAAMGSARTTVQRACPGFGDKQRALRGHAVLTGVQFHDTPHAGDALSDNARGAAVDEVELHPVLLVSNLTCAPGTP